MILYSLVEKRNSRRDVKKNSMGWATNDKENKSLKWFRLLLKTVLVTVATLGNWFGNRNEGLEFNRLLSFSTVPTVTS